MRTKYLAGAALLSVIAAGCGGQSEVTGPGASAALLGTNPTGPNTQGEEIVVCKVGGEGTYDFTYSGGAAPGGFSLDPGQCWSIGFFGGAGVSLTIAETPRTGHEVVSIAVDQLTSADQFVTGTNSVTGVKGSGSPKDAALVTFTNRLLPPPPPGDEGCTPGYWKNHELSWPATGYAPASLFSSVFAGYTTLSSALTLHGALDLGGGRGIEGAERNLARAATAALLNAAHPGVNYMLATSAVISRVNAAFASQNRDTMLALAGTLDGYNNYGCPLN